MGLECGLVVEFLFGRGLGLVFNMGNNLDREGRRFKIWNLVSID